MFGAKKKPFSGKKKKAQLQEKRQRKNQVTEEKDPATLTEDDIRRFNNEMRAPATQASTSTQTDARLSTGRGRFQLSNASKLRTVFEKEPKEFVEQRKLESRLPIVRVAEKRGESFYSQIIDIPKRPAWNYSMTKEQVEGQEQEMFEKYLDGIYSRFPIRRLNFFEHNLEVWRQLWRVCEVSDVLMILADVRHPMFHFPPALYHYVVRDLKKPLILVLTKVDLVPTENVRMWTKYFVSEFPGLFVASYCSYERKVVDATFTIGTKKKKRQTKKGYTPTGVEEIMEYIASLGITKKGRVVPVDYRPPNSQPAVVSLKDLEQNAGNIAKENTKDTEDNEDEDEDNEDNVGQDKDDEDEDGALDENDRKEELKRIEEAMNEDHYQPIREVDYIVLGLIGNPNVGKSTFINAMKGRKVCSTSRTPGHTKWKQTIFLNKNMMLVDCPGLVFPAVDMPKQLQILCGIFPIAQVREPFSAIQYMSKYVPIEQVYKLNINDATDPVKYDPAKGEIPWSSWMIAEAYAAKRGYHTRRGLDVHRAGLEILFDVIDGRVVLYFLPNQTTLNLGAFVDPDEICRPLQPKSENEPKLPDLPDNSSTLLVIKPETDNSKGSYQKRNRSGKPNYVATDLEAVEDKQPEDDETSQNEEEMKHEEEGNTVIVGSNPFDQLA